MDIHKPKPWHGWRELLKEIGTIVIGVLIALGAEQGVEWLHEQRAMQALRDGVRAELMRDRDRWEANRSQDACVDRRLDAILAWAAAASPQATLKDPKRPRLWNLHASAWDAAKANPAASHLPIAEHTAYAELYDAFVGAQRDLSDEQRRWVDIVALLQQGDSADDKRTLRKLAVVEKNELTRRRYNYAYIFGHLDRLNIPTQPLPQDDRASVALLCQPLNLGKNGPDGL